MLKELQQLKKTLTQHNSFVSSILHKVLVCEYIYYYNLLATQQQ